MYPVNVHTDIKVLVCSSEISSFLIMSINLLGFNRSISVDVRSLILHNGIFQKQCRDLGTIWALYHFLF